jgi:carbon starvation protein CstA
MKKIIHSYTNFIIVTLAVVFLVALVSFYSWAVEDAVEELHNALVTPSEQNITGFDFAGAAKLDFRGLITVTSSTSSASGN